MLKFFTGVFRVAVAGADAEVLADIPGGVEFIDIHVVVVAELFVVIDIGHAVGAMQLQAAAVFEDPQVIEVQTVAVYIAAHIRVTVAVAEHQCRGIPQVLTHADGVVVDFEAAWLIALVGQIDNPATALLGHVAATDAVAFQLDVIGAVHVGFAVGVKHRQ